MCSLTHPVTLRAKRKKMLSNSVVLSVSPSSFIWYACVSFSFNLHKMTVWTCATNTHTRAHIRMQNKFKLHNHHLEKYICSLLRICYVKVNFCANDLKGWGCAHTRRASQSITSDDIKSTWTIIAQRWFDRRKSLCTMFYAH